MKLFDLLECMAHNKDSMGWATVTSRAVPRRDMIRAVRAGLAVSVGEVVMEDDDGFIDRDSRGYPKT